MDAADRSAKRARRDGAGRALTRDPATWAWLLVALMALLPLRTALDAWSMPVSTPLPRVQAPAPAPMAERPPADAQG